jgi:hypothetical protein
MAIFGYVSRPSCVFQGGIMTKKKSPIAPAAMTRKDAALRLNLSERSVDYLREDGRLEFYKSGKKIQIAIASVESLVGVDLGHVRPRTKSQKAIVSKAA